MASSDNDSRVQAEMDKQIGLAEYLKFTRGILLKSWKYNYFKRKLMQKHYTPYLCFTCRINVLENLFF